MTGEVTLRLRRGDDYTIVDTTGPAFSYHPEKLSMERTEDAAFGPVDRIGQLTMRNLDIADSRAKLELYAAQGQLVGGHTAELVGELEPGGAAAIAAGSDPDDTDVVGVDEAQERSMFDAAAGMGTTLPNTGRVVAPVGDLAWNLVGPHCLSVEESCSRPVVPSSAEPPPLSPWPGPPPGADATGLSRLARSPPAFWTRTPTRPTCAGMWIARWPTSTGRAAPA